MPVEPPQYYTTALFDPPTGAQLRFLIVPDRSLPEELAPARGASHAASLLGLEDVREVEPDSWSLPLVFDAMTGRMPPAFAFRRSRAWRELPPLSSPSRFAQHAAFAPVIPVEASPIRGESMAGLMLKGGATAAFSLYGVTGEAVTVVYAAGITVICTAAYPVLLRLEAAVARLMDVELEQPSRDDEPGEPS